MKPSQIPDRAALGQQGFTLTELVVVIAILALLAALPLWASTTKAKLAAEQVRCMTNLKQLSLYAMLYATDYNSFLPYSSPGSSLWMGTLRKYDPQVSQLLVCPSAPSTTNINNTGGSCASAWTWGSSTPTWKGSYALNGWLYADGPGRSDLGTGYAFRKESSVQKPMLTPVFLDAVWVDLWPAATDLPATNLYSAGGLANPATIQRCCIPRHAGQDPARAPRNYPYTQRLPGAINIGFVDGRVQTTKLEQLWGLYWHWYYVPPARRPGLP